MSAASRSASEAETARTEREARAAENGGGNGAVVAGGGGEVGGGAWRASSSGSGDFAAAATVAIATTAADVTAPGTAASPVAFRPARQVPKAAYEYNIGKPLMLVLFSYKGTVWPLVKLKHELYLYPLLHTVLVLVQWSWQQQVDDRMDRGTFWRTVFEVTADDDGVDVGPKEYWETSNMMIPWKAVGTLTPLMIFTLVFFLSQCYSRFMTLFNACQLMETAIQDMTVLMLVHATRHEHRWDAVRYLTAAAITTYGRARANQVWDEPKNLDEASWKNLYAELDPRATPPEPRPTSFCPALLKEHEVKQLRRYPDSLVGLVLVTWCVQTLKELERNGELKGPAFGQAQGEPPNLPPPAHLRHPSPQPHVREPRCVPGSALKLRAASYKICNLLNLPIPLPYFHTLVVLQNVCFAIMSWSLLSFVSFLTPIVLFFAILVMVGLREVAVALSDPFGDDDVDFPVDKWIVQLRANALLVHEKNHLVQKPNRDSTQSSSTQTDVKDEEEHEHEEVNDDDDAGDE